MLTGLPNRRQLLERLSAALARRPPLRGGTAVLFLDLDGFKAINDHLGHAGGDHVLAEVATRLRGLVRPSDLVARLSGDEFVMLCDPIESSDQGRLIAERVATAVAHPVDLAPVAPDAPAVAVRASIGVAFLAPGDDAAALLGRADAAMYRAKRRGPGSVELAGGDEQVAAAPRSR